MTPIQAFRAGAVPLRPALTFDHVKIVRHKQRLFILLIGFEGARRIHRVVANAGRDGWGAIPERARGIAEEFGLDRIHDLAGAVDPSRGRCVYTLDQPKVRR